MNRIICVGNRYLRSDAAGPRVYDYLAAQELPREVEVIDGGLAGLNLLGLVDGCSCVVFVDSLEGFSPHPDVFVLQASEVPPAPVLYDHGAGIEYLFTMIPRVCDHAPQDLFLVGIEGSLDDQLIARAAEASLRLVSGARRNAMPGNCLYPGGDHDRVH